tara:strand:- start:537 stop:746 length:210 start_codon:yes stop_codon:yes gene_type:complete
MTELEFDNRQKYADKRVGEFKCKLSYAVTRELDYDDSLDGTDSDTAIKVLKIQMANLRRLLEENGIKTR